MTKIPKLGSISDMPRAANHAGIAVCNRDSESGLPKSLPLLATHGPIFCLHLLVLLLPLFRVGSVLSLIPHATARCEDDRYEVHTKLLAQELIDSGLIYRVKMTQLEKPPKFEPYPAPEQIFGNDKDMYYVWESATRS